MPVSSRAPHYVRVARALALLSGLAGLPACSGRTEPTAPGDSGVDADVTADAGGDNDAGQVADAGSDVDAGPIADAGGGTDAGPVADAGAADDAGGDRCTTCGCAITSPDGDAGPASCEALGYFECCPAVGPLFPPDLPA